MNNQKVVLINLSKGKIGGINAQLLGLVVVSKIAMAAMARQNIAKEEFNYESEKLRVSYWINYFNSTLDTGEQFKINSKLFYVDFLKLKKSVLFTLITHH